MSNKKVRNAQVTVEDEIKFKSKIEASCYKKLVEAGLKPQHEPEKLVLMPGFRLESIKYYSPLKLRDGTKTFGENTRKIIDMSYIPDFRVDYKDYIIYFDAKGHPNETYPLKKKLFLERLEKISKETEQKFLFFEPHSVKQILLSIDIIKSL